MGHIIVKECNSHSMITASADAPEHGTATVMGRQRKIFQRPSGGKLWQSRRIAPLSGHAAMRQSGSGVAEFGVYHVVYESSQLNRKGWTALQTVITMRRKNNTLSTDGTRCREWGQRVF